MALMNSSNRSPRPPLDPRKRRTRQLMQNYLKLKPEERQSAPQFLQTEKPPSVPPPEPQGPLT